MGIFYFACFSKNGRNHSGEWFDFEKEGAENIDKIDAWAADGKMMGLKNFRCHRVGDCGRMWVNVEEVEGYVYE